MAVLGLCCRAQAFSSCREQGILSSCGAGPLTAVASLAVQTGSTCRLQELRPVGSRAQAQYLRYMGLVAPWYVGSSWTRY